MKRVVLLIVVLALAAPFAALAEETHYQPGNVLASIGVGAGWGYGGFGLWVYPGAEFMFAKANLGGAFPLDFGIALKGIVGFSWARYIDIGAGAFGTAHLSET